MTKQPCLKVLIIFIFGIILGRYFSLPFYYIFPFLIVSFLISLLFFVKQKEIICNIFLSLAILSSGFILTINSIQNSGSKNLKKFIGGDVEITGKITDEPKIYPRWAGYDLSINKINNEEIKRPARFIRRGGRGGFVRLRIYGGRIFSYNDIIKFKTVLE